MENKKRAYQTGSWTRVDARKVRLFVSLGRGLGGGYERASRTVEAKTDAQAERALAAFVREMQGRKIGSGATLAQLMDDYKELHVSTLAPRTREWYDAMLRRAYGALGHVRLSDLTPVMLEKYYKGLADVTTKPYSKGLPNGLGATTVHHHYKALSAVLQWGYAHELLDRPFTRRVKAPASGGRSSHAFALDAGQRAAFLTALAAEGDRCAESISPEFRELQRLGWMLIGKLALACGLRRGEVMGVAWDDLELSGATITLHVRQQVQREGGRPVIRQLKTAASVRTIPVPGQLANDLQRLRQAQLAHYLRYTLGRPALLFATLEGQPRDPAHVSRYFRRVFDAAGIPDATFHTLRHTCGTYLLSSGYSPADVAAFMGHANPAVTLGVYAHEQQDQVRSMAETCAGLL